MIIVKRRNDTTPPPANTLVLIENNWDDFDYKTLFLLVFFDHLGTQHTIGNVKIGFIGQLPGRTIDHIPEKTYSLGENFFSVGQDAEYYQKLRTLFPSQQKLDDVLTSLRDIVLDKRRLPQVITQNVFRESLLRNGSLSTIENQYRRILSGGHTLSQFEFSYHTAWSPGTAKFNLYFSVQPHSTPPSNMHILVGRNGVGKTSILNGMVNAALNHSRSMSTDNRGAGFNGARFSSIISVSFSAFDPFIPPMDQPDRTKGVCYFYIGLKENSDQASCTNLKNITALQTDFTRSLDAFFGIESKRKSWVEAVTKLESDGNFAELSIANLASINSPDELRVEAGATFSKLSAGHAIVLLTITKLVEVLEEQTLVLMDEPESHLHPPLLSAFTRVISDLLASKNAIAIIATHSPVVVQEVPASCVWKLRRFGAEGSQRRPNIETFGENIGLLTNEIFGLEVTKSGFHELLKNAAMRTSSYNEALESFNGNLGEEGQGILLTLMSTSGSPRSFK